MNPNLPPTDPNEPGAGSLFEDFINRNLDLGGLDTGDGPEESDADELDAGENHILFQMQFPGGGPVLKGAVGAPGTSTAGARLPQLPLTTDARWQHVTMRERPGRLRVYKPRIGWELYGGQLVLTLGQRAPRHLDIIPDVRPGWTAIRYQTSQATFGELIEWRGNKAALHHLRLDGQLVAGFVKHDDMPPVRPARGFRLLPRSVDRLMLMIILMLILVVSAVLVDRLPPGDGPTMRDLESNISALQAQVATLEAQLASPP